MYSFEGDFRKKPVQSLGGASRKEQRESLLLRAAVERQKREDFRRKNVNATKIQSYVRACLIRANLHETERRNFDDLWKNVEKKISLDDEKVIGELSKRIIFFFKISVDRHRLVVLSQLLLKRHTLIARAILSRNHVWKYRIKRLLLLNISSLVDDVDPGASIATPMRMLEVYTSYRTYERVCSVELASRLLFDVFTFLIKNGYYEKLNKLIDQRVPDSSIKSSTPPTPLASSILDLIVMPVNNPSSRHDKFRSLVLSEISRVFFSQPFTPQISCFLLPNLASEQKLINFENLLTALYDDDSQRLTVCPSVYLLYTVLSFYENQKNDDSLRYCSKYILVLSELCKTLSHYNVEDESIDSDDENDDDEIMDTKSHVQSDVNELTEECVEIINRQHHVGMIISMVDANIYDSRHLSAICSICHSLLTRCKLAVHTYRLLYTLAFKSTFLRILWDSVASSHTTSIFGSRTPLLQVLARGLNLNSSERDPLLPQLVLFCSLFGHLLVTIHDSELYNPGKTFSVVPFNVTEMVGMALTLRDVCLGLIELAYPGSRPSVNEDYELAVRSVGNHYGDRECNRRNESAKVWSHLFRVVVDLVRQLNARDNRCQFCPKDHWLSRRVIIPIDRPSNLHFGRCRNRSYRPFRGIRTLTREELEDEGPPLSTTEVRMMMILRELPFVITFTDRVKIFQQLIQRDKMEHQSDMVNFQSGPMIQVMIRRNYIYEDAFDKLSFDNEPNLKLTMRVQLINAAGLDEAGIDGGGIFREFLNILLKTGFDPNRGFFKSTSDRLLYPNPHVNVVVDNSNLHYYFLGRMLGKAIYDNMLVELPFAAFFLCKLLGRRSTYTDMHHLDSLDPILYKHLLSLKTYEGDIAELGLDFTVINSELGEMQVEELKPGGSNIPVTSSNAIEYIHLVSDYKLNKQIREQCSAFKQGLANVINLDWLQMFNYRELQVLVSGASVPVDIEDLKKNINYSGSYSDEHIVIVMFWKVVEDFSQDQLRKLLKFVTSCSRPPLLGFKELYPPFCIHSGGNELDRLPTASTCMNLLKLPAFKDVDTLRDKLLYAIESESGFELS